MMIASHLLTRTGDKMWEFALPLILSSLAPDLFAAALFGLVTYGVRVIFGTWIGRKIDDTNRLKVISLGIGLQAVSVGCSATAIWFLLRLSANNPDFHFFMTPVSSSIFVALLLSGSVGSLAAMAMDIAIERDWVPTLITEDEHLTVMNARMRQADLVTEVGGPLVGGFLLLLGNQIGFMIIAGWNFLTFLPQYLLLVAVYYDFPILHKKAAPPAEEEGGVIATFCSPFYSLFRGWRLFTQQPIVLVTFSFTMLWLTILSPHDPVFTAYLMFAGYPDWELGIFRAIGAVAGVIAAFLFPAIARGLGLQKSMLFFIFEEGVMVAAAGVTLWLNLHGYAPEVMRYLFLVFVVLSRPGLYGFEVGEIQVMQQGVPENIRGSVSSVESSLTALAALIFFIPPIFVSNPQDFVYLIWASIGCINVGSLLFAIWSMRWDLSNREHKHGGTKYDLHNYLHSAAQQGILEEQAEIHAHLHFVRRGCC